MLCCSHLYSLVSSASPPLLLGNLPWVRLNSFTASRISSHWDSSLWLDPDGTKEPGFHRLPVSR